MLKNTIERVASENVCLPYLIPLPLTFSSKILVFFYPLCCPTNAEMIINSHGSDNSSNELPTALYDESKLDSVEYSTGFTPSCCNRFFFALCPLTPDQGFSNLFVFAGLPRHLSRVPKETFLIGCFWFQAIILFSLTTSSHPRLPSGSLPHPSENKYYRSSVVGF